MALVVKKWYANVTTPDREGNFVMVECRQEGIVAYILNALGIAPTETGLGINSRSISCRAAGTQGNETGTPLGLMFWQHPIQLQQRDGLDQEI